MIVTDGLKPTDVTVATKLKPTPNGTSYAAPVVKSYFVEDGRKLVRASTGEQVVSETTLFPPIADVDLFTEGSKITVNGRACTVIIAKRRIIGDPDLDHVEVNLT